MTASQADQATRDRADRLLAQIRHWLLAMEQYHNLRNATRRPFTSTNCTARGGRHARHVLLEPHAEGHRKTSVSGVAPRDHYPDDVLQARVLQPLREEGFLVSAVDFHSCGCATFNVRPRRLAGQ